MSICKLLVQLIEIFKNFLRDSQNNLPVVVPFACLVEALELCDLLVKLLNDFSHLLGLHRFSISVDNVFSFCLKRVNLIVELRNQL